MRLAASSAPVAVKCRAVDPVYIVKIFPVHPHFPRPHAVCESRSFVLVKPYQMFIMMLSEFLPNRNRPKD
jgi:hypothetical protein